MTKVKTAELSGIALDWAVHDIELERLGEEGAHVKLWVLEQHLAGTIRSRPSIDWLIGGPIIERERISLRFNDAVWEAMCVYENEDTDETYASAELGQYPLIAAMRCYVASKRGDEVDVPDAVL